MVLMVRVDFTGPVPEIAAGWATEQVGASMAPAGLDVTAHASATLPVKPPLGVTVKVEVVEAPLAMSAAGGALNVNVPGLTIGSMT